jgi:hypothetical protein
VVRVTRPASQSLARGDRTGATPMVADAIELYEHKGNLVAAAQARSLAG